jgi:hypothetical protein
MKYLKSIYEAIIDWQDQGLEEFAEDLYSEQLPIPADRFKSIGQDHNIEIVDYDEFYRELPDDEWRATAPPRGVPAFATVNPLTNRPRVILNVPHVDQRLSDYILHMLKHEIIHVNQFSRRAVHPSNYWDPNDRAQYFSQKDEVMAFSHSIADQLITMGVRRAADLPSRLMQVRLYRDIRAVVDSKTLKRYHKYIFLYLQQELGE